MGKRQKQYPKGALVRLTNDEHKRLAALAKKADLLFSRFLVESGLTGQAPTNEDRVQRERAILQLARAILQLARVGNNLNQIARKLNSQRGALSSRDIEKTFEQVKAALERIELLWQRGKTVSKGRAHFEELK